MSKRLIESIRGFVANRRASDKQKGFTMTEAMLALAIAAVVGAGAILAYNAVSARAEAQTLYNGLQAFLVDMAQYLQVYHTDQPGGETEVDASGMYAKPWGTLGTASVADVAVTCTALDVPIDACTGAGTPTGLTMPNPNMQRIANMPSLRHGDGGYDQDTAAEWHIPVSSTTALEVAFSLIPEVDGDGIGTAPIWASCTINDNATTPDTAAIFQIALDSKAVCDNLAQSVARLDYVQQVYCLDVKPRQLSTRSARTPTATSGCRSASTCSNGDLQA